MATSRESEIDQRAAKARWFFFYRCADFRAPPGRPLLTLVRSQIRFKVGTQKVDENQRKLLFEALKSVSPEEPKKPQAI